MPLHAADWNRFAAETDRLGLGLVRALPLARVDDLLQGEPAHAGATHVVVAAQTGPAYWAQLRALQRADAELAHHHDPLDTMTRRHAARLAGLLGEGFVEVRFPFASAVDFVTLGERAGVGARSRLKILIHPDFGPWLAFRMLFFVRDEAAVLPPPAEPLASACDGCAGPCVAACPAGALRGPAGHEVLDYAASFAYRLDHAGVCADGCAARLACPVGAAYRYPADFIAHAHHRAFAAGKAHLKTIGGEKQGKLF